MVEAQAAWSNSKTYTLLMILTDGMNKDMPETKQAIVAASQMALSIVIIGVGADVGWSEMEELDGDKKMLSAGVSVAVRDIVQFVPFSRFGSDPGRLAAEVLGEIPRQVVEFCTRVNFRVLE
jgi:ligand-binding SRPBCC domain-containing protein